MAYFCSATNASNCGAQWPIITLPFSGFDSGEYNVGKQLNEGRLNDWLVAWPGAFRLLTLMDTPDWDLLRPHL